MHVLLVDRQAAARSVLRSVLSEFSANVDEAHDVASAELLLARTQFDLALLDLSPPDFVALDVLRTLRQKESGSTRAPAVLFIAAEDVAKMPQAAELGVAHFQPKPFTAVAVRDSICAILGVDQLPLTQNRRATPRLRVPVRFKFRGSPDLDAWSSDFSLGGAYFVSNDAPPIGAKLNATVVLPHLSEQLSLLCEVLRVHMPQRSGSAGGFAVRFLDLAADARDKLAQAFSVPSALVPGLSVLSEAFWAKTSVDGHGLVLTAEGQADGRLVHQLDELLMALNAEVARRALPRVIVDIRTLEFMNSSCFKSMIGWIERVAELPASSRYEIRFLCSDQHKWQRRSLTTLRHFARDVVNIDYVAQ